MPVELRKRKPREEPAPPPARKRNSKPAKVVEKVKAALKGGKAAEPAAAKEPEAKAKAKDEEPAAPVVEEEKKVEDAPVEKAVVEKKAASGKVAAGETVDLDGFGGEVETNDGKKTTLKALVEESKAGVVLFTYPKASTPGCKLHSTPPPEHVAIPLPLRLTFRSLPWENVLTQTTGTTQACLFRDSYTPLTADGLAIYGLSTDSPKANTTFKERQKLPYPLLCDPAATLIAAIGLKKSPKGTQRGVFVVDKQGKVLLAEPGGPAATVEAVKKLVEAGKA
ncbi:Peroxiredoxin DOT5 [Paramyrothecium foliicola]|nr:Peroxiredoxin DOT5 [Paramyrothecium foliicola]